MVRKINKTNLLAAFSITALIFFSGFFLNSSLTSSKLTELREMQEFLDVESASLEAQFDLALQNPCNIAGLIELNNELNSFGDKIIYLEKISPENDINVDNLYNYYTVLEVKHSLFIEQVNEECKNNYPTILYFYSTNEDLCETCKNQGAALTALKQTNPDTMIYSFNVDSTSKVVGTLKQLYNISALPTLIINNEKSEHFVSRKDLEKMIQPALNESGSPV